MPPLTLFEASINAEALALPWTSALDSDSVLLDVVEFSRVADIASMVRSPPASTPLFTIRAKAPAPGTPSRAVSKGSPISTSSVCENRFDVFQPMLLNAKVTPIELVPLVVVEVTRESSTLR